MNEQENHFETRQEEKKKSPFKGLAKMVTAGVIGSVITLSVAPYIDSNQEMLASIEDAASLEGNEEVSSLDAVPVAHTDQSIADTIEYASEAIVGIVNLQQQQMQFRQQQGNEESVESGTGSGVIFKQNDEGTFIVTNNHVIEGANEIEVSLYNGEKVMAELIGTDPLTDIAVLKVAANIEAHVLEFGDSSLLRAGDQVLAIGNPLGLDLSRTVTQGIVSGVERTLSVTTSAGEWDLNVIQTDAAINPGNSGGALINTAGEVIGINSLKISESGVEGLGFAIPSNEVMPIIDEIIENGQVNRPYVGVGLASLNEIPPHYLQNLPNTVTEGAVVTTIDQESAAATAGLMVEDVLVSINGKAITDSSDLRKYLYTEFAIGDQVTIEFYRQGELQNVTLTLTSNQ
ncbi:S1C family serine protease [Bacillus suaedae]|uniref:Trypsin-like peptidase domain-containing protein n=1 Tax=Halalkalibacter suaedae TaxID=2822140 RepID=A0A940WYS5_9BACI|nr:trypsin-like peptidase domain-containing protein [Bacillus suaedae]MBP3953283.1 trypsin-like peptidase domain-containing protein [Bacillus suaedae]